MNREQLMKLFAEIDANLLKVKELSPLAPDKTLDMRNEFIIDYTYNSVAIEGNTMTVKETAMVLDGATIAGKPLREHLEIVGHRDAFQFVEDQCGKHVAMSEDLIKNIHHYVLMDKPEDNGIFRRHPVRILGAFHLPAQPYKIETLIQKLLQTHNERKEAMHIIEAIALFHIEFEGIHPFIDGNGRTGRLLINYELMQHGFPCIDVKYTDRFTYYQAFNEYYQNNNILAMTELLANYVNSRLKLVLEQSS